MTKEKPDTRRGTDARFLCAVLNIVYMLFLYVDYFRHAKFTTLFPADGHVIGGDFFNVYASGCAVWHHHLENLSDAAHYGAWVQQLRTVPKKSIFTWSYPPTWLTLTWIACVMGYFKAYVAYMIGTLALFAIACRTWGLSRIDILLLATSPIAWVVVITGHNGFLTAAAVLTALSWRGCRPAGSALATTLLTIKPHLGIFLPPLLVIERRWRTFALSCLFIGLWAALSVYLFGSDLWISYLLGTSRQQWEVLTRGQGPFLSMFVSPRGIGESNHWPLAMSWGFQVIYSLTAIGFYIKAMSINRGDAWRMGLLTMGIGCMAFPYLFLYDILPLSVAMLLAVKTHPEEPDMLRRLPLAWALYAVQFSYGRLHGGLTFTSLLAQVVLYVTLVQCCWLPRPKEPIIIDTA